MRYCNLLYFHFLSLLIPGGGASLSSSEYSRVGNLFYEMAIESNIQVITQVPRTSIFIAFFLSFQSLLGNNNGDFFPILGICLGFELVICMSLGDVLFCPRFDNTVIFLFFLSCYIYLPEELIFYRIVMLIIKP